MGTIALWCWHLSFSLLILATALAWSRSRSSLARSAAIALALAPLLTLHVVLAWITLRLRFRLGIEFAPWLAATGLLALHVLGALFLLARARRDPGAAVWPLGTLAVCALAALALDGTTLWNLELKARIEIAHLGLEAGRIAWRESPPRPSGAENAAQIYLEASKELQHGEDGVLDPWLPARLRAKAALDADDPGLRAALNSLEPALESVREATRRPTCSFEPEPGTEDASLQLTKLPVQLLLSLADALELEARVRAADGNLSGALADVQALLGLARHVVWEPSLISAMVASVVRSKAVAALAQTLSSQGLALGDLEAFDWSREPKLVDVGPHAMAREEAFCLGAVARLSQPDSSISFPGGTRGLARTRLASALYNAFMLEQEVAGLRQSMREIQALALLSSAELRVRQSSSDRLQSRSGSLAAYLVPNMLPVLLTLHRSDAELELAALAIDAARWKLEHGRYPQSLAELGRVGGLALLEGDGTFVRLTRPDAGEAQVRLPPETQVP